MRNDVYQILLGDFDADHFLRLQENENLRLYLGKDANGRYTFEFQGMFNLTKIKSSDVIAVVQLKGQQFNSIRFSLENPDLLEYFSTFCQDLLNSTHEILDDNIAYRTLQARYNSWKKLFRPSVGKLGDSKIMGLIGELLYLRDIMIPKHGIDKALESWTGTENTHKDFSLENEWHEVKAITVGRGVVSISSIEQLDSDIDGTLAIYQLEKMSPSFNGLKLNSLVQEVFISLENASQKEIFMNKLAEVGYSFTTDYDSHVFTCPSMMEYLVNKDFPKLERNFIPNPIQHVAYEIILAEIESFKLK